MSPLFFLGVSTASLLVVLTAVLPGKAHEQRILLAPGQKETSIVLAAKKERIELSGAHGTTWVTFNAPQGKRFKINALNYYTLTTQPGQIHERTFELLKAASDASAGHVALRMTVLEQAP